MVLGLVCRLSGPQNFPCGCIVKTDMDEEHDKIWQEESLVVCPPVESIEGRKTLKAESEISRPTEIGITQHRELAIRLTV